MAIVMSTLQIPTPLTSGFMYATLVPTSTASTSAASALIAGEKLFSQSLSCTHEQYHQIPYQATPGDCLPIGASQVHFQKMEAQEIRKINLTKIKQTLFDGSMARLSEAIERQPSYVSALFSGQEEKRHRRIGEKLAREIEQKLSLEPGALDILDESIAEKSAIAREANLEYLRASPQDEDLFSLEALELVFDKLREAWAGKSMRVRELRVLSSLADMMQGLGGAQRQLQVFTPPARYHINSIDTSADPIAERLLALSKLQDQLTPEQLDQQLDLLQKKDSTN